MCTWQPKAWYDSATCSKWVAGYAMAEIDKTECGAGKRHLILCGNPGGQTRKANPKWSKLLEDIRTTLTAMLMCGIC